MGTHGTCTLRNDLLKDGEDSKTKIAVGDAKNRIIEAKLWTPGNKGAKGTTEPKNASPKRTLTKEDFALTDEKLLARALAVASALGDTTARGRIGSLKFTIEEAKTFDEWWSDVGSPFEKTRLLMDKKHHESVTADQQRKLCSLVVNCPFRGPLLPPSDEEGEEEEDPEPTREAPKPKASLQTPTGKGKTPKLLKQ